MLAIGYRVHKYLADFHSWSDLDWNLADVCKLERKTAIEPRMNSRGSFND
jgi:hypothetical protein